MSVSVKGTYGDNVECGPQLTDLVFRPFGPNIWLSSSFELAFGIGLWVDNTLAFLDLSLLRPMEEGVAYLVRDEFVPVEMRI